MAAKPLPNYLRMHRRRSYLTQDEVAFLVGGRAASWFSRFERFRRVPSLETALALEAVLGVPVRELFAGEYAKVEETVKRRAKVLGYKVRSEEASVEQLRRSEFLRKLEEV